MRESEGGEGRARRGPHPPGHGGFPPGVAFFFQPMEKKARMANKDRPTQSNPLLTTPTHRQVELPRGVHQAVCVAEGCESQARGSGWQRKNTTPPPPRLFSSCSRARGPRPNSPHRNATYRPATRLSQVSSLPVEGPPPPPAADRAEPSRGGRGRGAPPDDEPGCPPPPLAIIVSLAAPPPAPERREGEGVGLDGSRAWGWGTEGAGEPLVRWGPFG